MFDLSLFFLEFLQNPINKFVNFFKLKFPIVSNPIFPCCRSDNLLISESAIKMVFLNLALQLTPLALVLALVLTLRVTLMLTIVQTVCPNLLDRMLVRILTRMLTRKVSLFIGCSSCLASITFKCFVINLLSCFPISGYLLLSASFQQNACSTSNRSSPISVF